MLIELLSNIFDPEPIKIILYFASVLFVNTSLTTLVLMLKISSLLAKIISLIIVENS